MDSRAMQLAVEIELRQSDRDYELKDKLESVDIFYYLTKSERDFIQEIYKDGIDKNENNKTKLGKLLIPYEITDGITATTFYPNSFNVELPTDVLYVVNERALITIDSESIDNLYVKPMSYDEYNVNKDNPFRKPTKDKVLRLEGSSQHTIVLPESGVNVLEKIYLDYVKTPLGVNLTQDCELHEDVHPVVVTGAVALILGAKQDQVGYQIQDKEEKENK